MTYFLFTYKEEENLVVVKAITNKRYLMLCRRKLFADNVLNEYLFYRLISQKDIVVDYSLVINNDDNSK